MINPTITAENKYCAHNYSPLPVVLVKGKGVYVWDDQGKQYLDMMSAYSAVSHGHCHPRLVKVLTTQANQLNVVSRAFYSDKLAPFLQKACDLTGQEVALPMNTGAEAVETALKAARKWGYEIKGVAKDQCEIIACENNFHGRTITIVGMSSESQYRNGFGPFPDGFKLIPFNDVDALKKAITPNTAAFLVEPIQGEGGIIVPDPGYLAMCFEICRKNNVLLICDEIQTGLGRTGQTLACDYDHVTPDGVILGKAIGGGLMPVSLFLSRQEVMDVFTPGDHGSTFGGNPLAAAVALEALQIFEDEQLANNALQMGDYFMRGLKAIKSPLLREIRGRGLLIGMEIEPRHASARSVCEKLMHRGILSKETHETVVRFAPPLVITQAQINEALKIVTELLVELEQDAA